METPTPHANTISCLAALLRGENNAFLTYERALASDALDSFAAELTICRNSHERRVELLRQQIYALGGTPSSNSGVWDSFTRALAAATPTLRCRAALTALEEGEERRLHDYQATAKNLEPAFQAWVNTQLLRQQIATHRIVQSLERSLC